MRVFVTGSTGYVGSAVVRALVAAGHEVGGLVRHKEKVALARSLGAVPIEGNLRDFETYQHFAAESQAVIHCGFENPETDQEAVEDLIGALQAEGGEKTFIYTSGVWVLGNTKTPADEERPTDDPAPIVRWRPPVERLVLSRATTNLATSVLRPGLVYGGTQGIFGSWVQAAIAGQPVTFIGDGKNRIPPIHRDDLAALYLKVLEKKGRGIFHGVDGTWPTIEECARAVAAAGGNAGTKAWPLDQARMQLGAFADAMVVDQQVVPKRSRELGWKPRGPFLELAKSVVAEARTQK